MPVRIEYLGFQNLDEHREFRFRVHASAQATEHRLRIPLAAFGARLRLQDGPDICYQRLLHTVESGESVVPDVITIDDVELAAYREAHTPVPRGSMTQASASTPRAPLARKTPLTPFTPRPVPPPVVEVLPAFQQGQRVRHALFGEGVTATSSDGHTAVCFDRGGTKTFVTSLLQVDVLSAPHAWETSARGVNRPNRSAASDDQAASAVRRAK